MIKVFDLKDLSDFNGQDKLVDNLKVFVEAAKLREGST